jgi:hypothetical protein
MSGGVVLAVLNGYLTKFGSGRHQDAIPFAHLDPLLRYAFVARQIYQFSLMTTKLGICAFYRRIFQDRTSKFIIWGMMAFVVCSSIPVMIAVFLQCQPREGRVSSCQYVSLNLILIPTRGLVHRTFEMRQQSSVYLVISHA